MLDLGKPTLQALGVALFADHADPSIYYYLPSRPRLRVGEGRKPELRLVKYRLDAAARELLGGGLLSLTVDLSVPVATLDEIRGKLHAAEGHEVRLAPVSARDGICRLVLLDRVSDADGAESQLVHHVFGEGKPALYGTNAATFMAVLSPEAARLVEASLGEGGLPAGVAYELEVPVLQPALRARIRARWKDLYDFFEARMQGGKLLVAVDVGPTIEQLIHDELLKIEIDELVPEAQRSAVFQRAVERAQRYVLDEFFEPVLGQQPPAEDDGGLLGDIHKVVGEVLGIFSLTFSLRHIVRQEDRSFDFQLNAANAEIIRLSPQGLLSDLLRPSDEEERLDLSGIVVEVESGPNPELSYDIGCLVDLAAEGIDRLEVRLRHGAREELLLLDATTPRGTFNAWFDEQSQGEVHYAYTLFFNAGVEGLPPTLSAPERSTRSRVIRLDPRELYQSATVQVLARGLPFDRYPSVLVDLRVRAQPRAQTLELSQERPSGAWNVRSPPEAPVSLERRIRYVDTSGRELVQDWDPIEGGVLIVGDPCPDILDVQLLGSARFGSHVARVIVEFRLPSKPDVVYSRVLDATTPFATWSAPLENPQDRRWEYRVTLHSIHNEVREGDWCEGQGARLQVGESIWQIRDVELLFLGASFTRLGLLGIKVRFSYTDAEHQIHEEAELLVRDPGKPVPWSYPIADPTKRAFTYQLTSIRADGELVEREPVSVDDKLVVVVLESP